MNRVGRLLWISRLRSQTANVRVAFTVVLAITAFITQSARAQTFTLLQTFNYTNGAQPYNNSLIRDQAGNFYSATDYGDLGACFFGCGVVFKLSANGKETVLHKFTGNADGEDPYGGLIQDPNGNFYGTTSFGGPSGFGTIFKLDKTGKLTTLHGFTGAKDGGAPLAGLVCDRKGNLYGTTAGLGAAGEGTVFKLNAAGKFTVLHTFGKGADGQYPGYGALLLDVAGNLYGTTVNGGGGSCQDGCGVVFKVDKTGKETVLYSFTGGADGANPYSSLIQDNASNLYGTTVSGGTGCAGFGCGVVFKLDRTGKESVLYSFGAGNDGANPRAGLYRDAKGILYGTTYAAGAHGVGTIFKLAPR